MTAPNFPLRIHFSTYDLVLYQDSDFTIVQDVIAKEEVDSIALSTLSCIYEDQIPEIVFLQSFMSMFVFCTDYQMTFFPTCIYHSMLCVP